MDEPKQSVNDSDLLLGITRLTMQIKSLLKNNRFENENDTALKIMDLLVDNNMLKSSELMRLGRGEQ